MFIRLKRIVVLFFLIGLNTAYASEDHTSTGLETGPDLLGPPLDLTGFSFHENPNQDAIPSDPPILSRISLIPPVVFTHEQLLLCAAIFINLHIQK